MTRKKQVKANSRKKKQSGNRKKKSSQPLSKKKQRELLLQKDILSFFQKNAPKTYTVRQLAGKSGMWQELPNNKIRMLMDRLASSGKLEYLDKGKYRFLARPKTLTGQIQITRSGVAFLLQEEKEDIFIGPSKIGKALNGDIVKIKLIAKRRKEGRQEGIVLEVVHRARNQFVGTVEESIPGSFFVLPDDPTVPTDFLIQKQSRKGVKPGEKALVRLVSWERRVPEVEVVQVLGEAGEHNTEMHAILLQYGFQTEFPPHVEMEAKKIPEAISESEIKARRDMRETATFTIDPVDAKDFDDALSLRPLGNGRFEVGVHIADVSHYVRPGTDLDKEAFQRATSVYLVDRTVPMLPEKLSNKVCSLRPHEEKLTYSAVFEMDKSGKVFQSWIGRTVILSDHRFTYEQAQDVIEGKSEGPFKDEMDVLQEMALNLRKKRMSTGSIEFESNEVKFILDEDDKPVKVQKYIIRDSNRLIEDFMLLANRTVAKFIHDLKDNPPLPSVYRIHDSPDPRKLESLREFVGAFGHKVAFNNAKNTSESLNKLLKKVHGAPEQNVIESLAIRSMAKAVYSTKNIGHFGLGFPFYTHFTSPIRRYPDLMIHRLLAVYGNQAYRENPVVMEEQLKHCSERERTAAEAERASVKYKQVEFMQERIGQSFQGVISGVVESGIFVELDENTCEGMVPVRTMEHDYFVYDADTYSLKGTDTGEVLRLGDRVEVQISGTDLQRRTIDMTLIQKLAFEKS